ncbi:hypothetical protein D3C80_1439040 [compost metagenome]
MHRYLEFLTSVGRNGEPGSGFAACQLHLVEENGVNESAYRQAHVVGVVDAKAQPELLLQQARANHLDVNQLHIGILEAAAHPGRAAAEAGAAEHE